MELIKKKKDKVRKILKDIVLRNNKKMLTPTVNP